MFFPPQTGGAAHLKSHRPESLPSDAVVTQPLAWLGRLDVLTVNSIHSKLADEESEKHADEKQECPKARRRRIRQPKRSANGHTTNE